MNWDKSNIFLRILLLVIICAFAIYFVYMNEKSKKIPKETFVTNIEQDYRASIKKVFNETLHRDPYEFEVMLYRDNMKTPYDVDNIRNNLMNSKEYKNLVDNGLTKVEPSVEKTKLNDSLPTLIVDKNDNLDKRMSLYRSIVSVYENNLFRMPTMIELNYYTDRFNKDPSFTIEKLTQILQMSKEYRILEKNQTNLVNADLEGNITDAQVTLIVNNLYKSVYGIDPPSADLQAFLKTKYTEYKFDDKKFIALLRVMHDLDLNKSDPTNIKKEVNVNKNEQQGSSKTNMPSGNTKLDPKKSTEAVNSSTTNVPSKEIKLNNIPKNVSSEENNNNTKILPDSNAFNAPKNEICNDVFGNNWNPQISTTSSTCKKNIYDINKFYDSLYENNKIIDVNICMPNNNTYADSKLKRNQDELSYSCSRNDYYTLVDEKLNSGVVNAYDINVRPSYRNTKYGAFLDDADNTKVGSILPKFVFKEYVEPI